MIQPLPYACYKLEPSPGSEDHDVHYLLFDRALKEIADQISEAREEDDADDLARAQALSVIQYPTKCSQLLCDSCSTEYEDDEEGTFHIADDADEKAAVAAAVDAGWTHVTGGRLHCTTCTDGPSDDRKPGTHDVPLPIGDHQAEPAQ